MLHLCHVLFYHILVIKKKQGMEVKCCKRRGLRRTGGNRMNGRTLADISTGPDWVLYVVIIVFAVISVFLLLGKGAWLIAGYNTSSDKQKQKYDEKKLCRVTGGGMLAATALLAVTAVFEDVLPAESAGIMVMAIFLDCIIMIILGNTICRKKGNE